MVVVGREARSGRSLKRALFGSRAARADRIAGLYELSLHRALEPGKNYYHLFRYSLRLTLQTRWFPTRPEFSDFKEFVSEFFQILFEPLYSASAGYSPN